MPRAVHKIVVTVLIALGIAIALGLIGFTLMMSGFKGG